MRRKACQAFSTNALDIDACNPPAGSLNPFGLRLDLEQSFDAVTPKVGISFDSALGLVYANWARGFKSGGFDGRIGYNGAGNAGAGGAQAQAYDPEFADTFELGWKTAATDGTWQMSAAAFFNDYSDLQLSSFSATPSGGFATVFTNAGKAETLGLELELAARPTENLLVNINLGLLDAQYIFSRCTRWDSRDWASRPISAIDPSTMLTSTTSTRSRRTATGSSTRPSISKATANAGRSPSVPRT